MAVRPNLFLVGAPKSGTTSLYHYLRQHPQVFMSVPKETHFLSTDRYRANRISEEEYFRLFESAREEKWVCDASTGYIYSEAATEQIKDRFPGSKIIIMLRNPIDKIYSGHAYRLWKGYEENEDFEKALDAEMDDEGKHRIGLDLLTYVESASYSKHVERYLEAFGRENVHVIIFDDFIADTETAFEGLCEFLDIEKGLKVRFERHNESKRARFHFVSRLTLQSSWMRRAGNNLPGPLGTFLRLAASALVRWNTLSVRRPPMSPAVRGRLEREFESDVVALGRLLGRDLVSLWLTSGPVVSSTGGRPSVQ